MMDVKTIITPSLINGQDRKVGNEQFLTIENVWNSNKQVRLVFPSGDSVEVHVDELRKALDNATNNEVK